MSAGWGIVFGSAWKDQSLVVSLFVSSHDRYQSCGHNFSLVLSTGNEKEKEM